MIEVCQREIERVGVARTRDHDTLVEESALQLLASSTPVAVLMRTPGADSDLLRGLLFTEGLGRPAFSVAGNVAHIELPVKAFAGRGLSASAACGVCGRAEIDELRSRHAVCLVKTTIAAATVHALPAKMRAQQAAFGVTGGLHAAALFHVDGTLLAVREDVGRHNAVDKIIGWGLDAGVDFGQTALMLSGRLGFELVQKAVAAGIPIVAAVSAPSTLAVEVADQFRIAALGFVRDGTFNIYAHGGRVV